MIFSEHSDSKREANFHQALCVFFLHLMKENELCESGGKSSSMACDW
jgi:hypothetical protein